MPSIEELRKRIDGIDDRLLDLLNQRAKLVIDIGKIKKKDNAELHVPQREKQIIERLASQNSGPFPNDSLRAVLREIFSASLSLERPVKIAYLGPRATFSHLACLQRFGYSAHYVPVNSIKEVFAEVERGLAEYGVVPIENSTEGVVSYTLDMFMDSDLKISGEVMLEVSHYLMNKTGRIEDVRKIYSHPQPLAQCKNWLENNMKGVAVAETSSTTKAAEMASEDPTLAAIASRLAADLYGLRILRERIEDYVNNYTRFLVISKKSPARTGHDKTSILFSVKDRPGALYEMLRPFAERDISLTKIESRPSRKKAWEYHFYVDMEGHYEDEKVRQAVEDLGKNCLFVKVLGAYPAADTAGGE
ncbi:MAG TPA: prephenate dehydratase [Nitrospirota bacterium]|nr:prephenate dehydratase [Nitrospirota bacterium]